MGVVLSDDNIGTAGLGILPSVIQRRETSSNYNYRVNQPSQLTVMTLKRELN